MAQNVKLDWNTFSCSLCLDLLKAPVTTPCGHSYCRECVRDHWGAEEAKGIYSCPQCSSTFKPRPVLETSTVLAALVEALEKTGHQAAAADHCFARAEDVACDVCAGRKLKALRSCLDCRASYCNSHLQPHYQSSAFQRHRLVEPTQELQEHVCTSHDELRKQFCHSDQKITCFHCFVHCSIGVGRAAFALSGQRSQDKTRKMIQELIHDREEDLKVLQREMKDISESADKAMKKSKDMFTQMINLLEKRCIEVQQQVRSRQEAETSRVKELQRKLEQKIVELKRRDAWLERISHTQDLLQFTYQSGSYSRVLWQVDFDAPRLKIRQPGPFEELTGAVAELSDKMQEFLMETQVDISRSVCNVEVFEPELRTREDFLKHWRPVTLDPNTADRHLLISEDKRKVTHVEEELPYPDHPDRFIDTSLVLSKESLTGKCYWELELGGNSFPVVTYWDISRRPNAEGECRHSFTDKFWLLVPFTDGYIFRHNSKNTRLYAPASSRVGVYLDHSKGLLSFYAVCGTMELIHTVKTTFTQPLHAALSVGEGSSAEVCDLGTNSQF